MCREVRKRNAYIQRARPSEPLKHFPSEGFFLSLQRFVPMNVQAEQR